MSLVGMWRRCVANGERASSCGGERMEGDGQLWSSEQLW